MVYFYLSDPNVYPGTVEIGNIINIEEIITLIGTGMWETYNFWVGCSVLKNGSDDAILDFDLQNSSGILTGYTWMSLHTFSGVIPPSASVGDYDVVLACWDDTDVYDSGGGAMRVRPGAEPIAGRSRYYNKFTLINAPVEAVISVYSTPSPAELYIDESYMGTTPRNETVTIGNHMIRISKSGYEDSVEMIYVPAGGITINRSLSLIDACSPEGIDRCVDGYLQVCMDGSWQTTPHPCTTETNGAIPMEYILLGAGAILAFGIGMALTNKGVKK